MSAVFAPEQCLASGSPRPAHADSMLTSHTRPPGGRVIVRVVIASHQPIFRFGLRGLLAAEPELEIVGESSDGADALRLARQLRPDLLLVDMGIQTLDAMTVTRTIRSELRDTQVIIISGGNDDASAVGSVRAGATAYLRREARSEELLRAIRSAVAGQVVIPARAVAQLLQSMG